MKSMANKRFNLIFKDGCEYEATVTSGGAVEIRSESGKVLVDLGPYTTRDVLEILDSIRTEIMTADNHDKLYDNPLIGKEEAERMELEYNELKEIIKKDAREFVDGEAFETLSEAEKDTLKQLMNAFVVKLALDITNAEMDALDRMAEVEQ